jgi:hypothetical protein
MEFLATAIRQQEEIEGKYIGKKVVKLFLFAEGMTLPLNDLKNYTRKLLDTTNSLSKGIGYNIDLQKSVAFLCSSNEQTEKEYGEIISFTIASRKIKCLWINLTKDVKDFYKENYKLLKK